MESEKLQIYRDTYDLVILFMQYVTTFPKKYKYTLGDRLVVKSLDLFTHIQNANRFLNQRRNYLDHFLVEFGCIKTIVRVCCEMRIFSIKQEAELTLLMTKISRQAVSWKNSSK